MRKIKKTLSVASASLEEPSLRISEPEANEHRDFAKVSSASGELIPGDAKNKKTRSVGSASLEEPSPRISEPEANERRDFAKVSSASGELIPSDAKNKKDLKCCFCFTAGTHPQDQRA